MPAPLLCDGVQDQRRRHHVEPDTGPVDPSSSSSLQQQQQQHHHGAASAGVATCKKELFLEKVRRSTVACQSGDYERAVQLYTEAIVLDPANHVLYGNRSAAFIKVGNYGRALQDAVKARELHPKWAKAYYRQGVALQCQERHADALAAFASGLAQEPKSIQLLAGLVESAMKSPLCATLEPTYRQLQSMHLDKSPFVIVSVIGQELLAAGHYAAAVVVLESALHVGTCSLKLRGSVFSALSSSYWALNCLDKAINYMQKDLAITKSLGDIAGECRAHGNLGSAYFSKGNHKEALTSHRYQLVLAMKCKDTQAAASALTSLGHVYTAIGDYPNALASHKQCVQLVKQVGDGLQEAREIGNVGAVYLAMGDFDSAVECHLEHVRLAERLGNRVEEARAYSNLGSSHHFKRNFDKAIAFHERVLRLARDLGDRGIEARAYAGLGHAARCRGDYEAAKHWHERQLDTSLSMRDKMGEGRACSNLGIVYQLLGEYDSARRLHQAHLNVARTMNDRAGIGRACGNIGNAHSSMGNYEEAIKYHKQELTISKEVNDRSSEASTHGNLAVAYQALGMSEMALLHYNGHLNIARELKDTAGEACALLNMANCHSSCGDFAGAVNYYESYLMLSQELHDVEGEAKACHFLGYAHYVLGNFKEAVRYYNQDLSLAKDLQDTTSIGRAHCNLGLSHLALGNYLASLECQKYFLAIAHMMKHAQGKFRALGNIGDVLMRMKNTDEAIHVYQKQLQLAKQSREKSLEATAYGALGLVFRTLLAYDKALGYHTQELTLRQETNDLRGECKAHGHLAQIHMSLFNYTNAIKCYEEQLERAKELKDLVLEAQAFGNLGIARLNMGHFEDAIGYFEQQLAILEQVSGTAALLDKGRGFGSLGECYYGLADFDEAVKCHEQYSNIALSAKSLKDQNRAYSGLGNSQKCMGNLQQALVCFEKRLVVAFELNDPSAKSSAYGDLGQVHSKLGNYEQAVSCLEHQLMLTRGLEDRRSEADAVCGLGSVFHQMGEYEKALRYHEMDLMIAEETGSVALRGRAFGNIGVAHESLGNFEKATSYQEQHLSIADQVGDNVAKMLAYSSLGRVHQSLGNLALAISFLQQGLQIAEVIGCREDEANIRHRLGVALWSHGDLVSAQIQLFRAVSIFEAIRRECSAGTTTDYRLSLFDLQTASYQALQRVLVGLDRKDEALAVAERARTRAVVDLFMERQGETWRGGAGSSEADGNSHAVTVENLVDIVNQQKAVVLYYSLAAGYLYTWLIVPNKGIVSFNESCISGSESESDSQHRTSDIQSDPKVTAPSAFATMAVSDGAGSLLEQYISNVRETLGVEALTSTGATRTGSGDSESEASYVWSQHLDELGDKLNQEGDRSGFLRMVNRGHLYNSSSYSLSSLFSLGSMTTTTTINNVGSSVGRSGRSSACSNGAPRKPTWAGPACLRHLYDLLLGSIESHLPKSGVQKELVLVLEGDLFLVPFAVLRGNNGTDYLCERFDLRVASSIGSLGKSRSSRSSKRTQLLAECSADQNASSNPSSLVVGNPKLSTAIADQWGWTDVPYAHQEANCVAEILGTDALLGAQATKEAVIREMSRAEVIHLATNVSWKFSAIVLSPVGIGGGAPSSKPSRFCAMNVQEEDEEEENENNSKNKGDDDANEELEVTSTVELPSLSEFLLTAADILNLRLVAKLVVVSSCHTRNHHGRASSDGVVGLTRALLAAGAQCVLISLWPVPDTAVKILFRTFYSSLLQGSRVSRALSEAITNTKNTKHFAHPANWGGFTLIGADVKISSKVALMGQALRELLSTPDACRDSLRVVLHLVEKSLQRIHWRQRNAMYTTQKSIENKVGPTSGWKDLLMSVGFRFEPAANGIPASVFFPQSDPGERLTQCSASLQALLGLSSSSLNSLSKLLCCPEVADDVINLVRQVIAQMNMKDGEVDTVEIPISVKLWRVHGCHELLASLGFDLMDVGLEDVTLRAGKQASKRQTQFVVQALLALFDTQEAPRTLGVDDLSSSSESLVDDDDDDDTDSPPPPLPTGSPGMFLRSLDAVSTTDQREMTFSSFVRNRGEPDGRQMTSSDGVQASLDRKNDAFTPSPVDRLTYPPISSSNIAANVDVSTVDCVQPVPPPRLSLALAHQTKIRALYTAADTLEVNSASSSSSSSTAAANRGDQSLVANWESGQMTVRRQPRNDERTAKSSQQGNSGNRDSKVDFVGTVRRRVNALNGLSPEAKMAVRVETRRLSSLDRTKQLQRQQQQSINDTCSMQGTENAMRAGVSNFLTLKTHGQRSVLNVPGFGRLHHGGSGGGGGTAAAESTGYSTIRDYSGDDDTCLGLDSPGVGPVGVGAAHQLSRLDRREVLPITDVYHDRSLGLDLAPSLSTLLVNANVVDANKMAPPMSQATVDAVRSNLDLEGLSSFFSSLYDSDVAAATAAATSTTAGVTVAVSAHEHTNDSSRMRANPLQPPSSAPLPQAQIPMQATTVKQPWTQNERMSVSSRVRKSPPPPPLPRPRVRPSPPPKPRGLLNLASQTRDEGDGRSMTDSSHYSGPPLVSDAAPKGTDIQSAYSSFTLYKPNRDGAKRRDPASSSGGTHHKLPPPAPPSSSSSSSQQQTPLNAEQKPSNASSKHQRDAPTFHDYATLTLPKYETDDDDDDELDSVSMTSAKSRSNRNGVLHQRRKTNRITNAAVSTAVAIQYRGHHE